MPYRIDPNTGQPVWDGTSIPQASRDSLSTQIRELQAQIDALSFIDLDDVPTTYTGQSGKILSVKSAENGLEFITNSGGSGVTDGDKGDVVVSSSGTVWTLDTSGVTAGSYTLLSATVDAKGRVTAASSGTVSASTISDGTTVGRNILKLTNPSAVTFVRMNADNTVTARTPSETRSDLSLGGAALLAVGTAAGTVAAGDDARFHSAASIGITLQSVIDFSGQDLVAVTSPPADRIVFFDQSEGAWEYLEVGSGLSISGQTLTATGSGDVIGPASSVDNTVARFDSTTGKLIQASSIVIEDASTTTQNNVCLTVSHSGQTNSALVLCPQGTFGISAGPKPDGTTTGGNTRGTHAMDFQILRTANTQVASATRSAIIGGQNHTAGGTDSACVGGNTNLTSGGQTVCLGGSSNQAYGTRAAIVGGMSNTTLAQDCFIAGSACTASSQNAITLGLQAVSNRLGQITHANGQFSTVGDAQRSVVIVKRQTTDATQTELTLNGSTPAADGVATTSNRIVLLNNQTIMADVFVVARSASGTNDAAYHRRALVTRDANAASTAITGLQIMGVDMETAGAALWDVTLAAETTYGSLQVLVTGAAATNINWMAEVILREVIRT